MKALLIEFDLGTGRRAGGISPKDPGLRCHAWQNLDSAPAKEIRLIEDERDVKQYENIKGVTVLNTDDEIEEAIEKIVPEKICVEDEMMMRLDIEQRGIQIKDIRAGNTIDERHEIKNRRAGNTTELLHELKKLGVKGITTSKPLKLKEVIKSKQ